MKGYALRNAAELQRPCYWPSSSNGRRAEIGLKSATEPKLGVDEDRRTANPKCELLRKRGAVRPTSIKDKSGARKDHVPLCKCFFPLRCVSRLKSGSLHKEIGVSTDCTELSKVLSGESVNR